MISMYYGKIGICPLFNYIHPDYVKCVLAPIKEKKKKATLLKMNSQQETEGT